MVAVCHVADSAGVAVGTLLPNGSLYARPVSPSRPSVLHQLAAVAADLGPGLAPVDLQGALTAVAEAAREAFGAAACSVVEIDEEASEVVWLAVAGEGAATAVGMRLPITRGLTGYVANSGQALAVEDVRQDPRFAADAAATAGYVPSSMLVVPVTGPEGTIGALSLLDRDTSSTRPTGDLELAARFADVVAQLLPIRAALGDLGAVLLRAAADAAEDGDLAGALRRAAARAPGPSTDLKNLAALLAELGRMGPPERVLAHDVTESLLVYAHSRRRR